MSEDSANPLLLGWIKEWLDQARERSSRGATVFECLDSICSLTALTDVQLQKGL